MCMLWIAMADRTEGIAIISSLLERGHLIMYARLGSLILERHLKDARRRALSHS